MSSPRLTPPPSASPPPSPPESTDTVEPRPRRLWYLVAGLIVVLTLSLGTYLLTVKTDVSKPTPEFVGQIEGEGSAIFYVDERESGDWGLYASPGSGIWDCTLSVPDPAYRLMRNIGHNERPYETDDGEWELVGVLSTEDSGVHTLHCSGSASDRYAVGSMDAPMDADGRLGVAVFGGIMIPVGGVFSGGIMSLVVLLMRSSHKARLRSEQALRRYAATHGGPPAHGGFGHGHGRPGGPVPPLPLAPIDPREIRPRARWFWIGGLAVPGGLALGLLTLTLVFSSHEDASEGASFTFAMLSLLVLTLGGFLFGLTTVIVTAVRRERHRARLVREHRAKAVSARTTPEHG